MISLFWACRLYYVLLPSYAVFSLCFGALWFCICFNVVHYCSACGTKIGTNYAHCLIPPNQTFTSTLWRSPGGKPFRTSNCTVLKTVFVLWQIDILYCIEDWCSPIRNSSTPRWHISIGGVWKILMGAKRVYQQKVKHCHNTELKCRKFPK